MRNQSGEPLQETVQPVPETVLRQNDQSSELSSHIALTSLTAHHNAPGWRVLRAFSMRDPFLHLRCSVQTCVFAQTSFGHVWFAQSYRVRAARCSWAASTTMRLPSPCTRSTIRGARPHGVQDTNPNPNPNPNPDPNQVQGQGVQDTGAPAWSQKVPP